MSGTFDTDNDSPSAPGSPSPQMRQQ